MQLRLPMNRFLYFIMIVFSSIRDLLQHLTGRIFGQFL